MGWGLGKKNIICYGILSRERDIELIKTISEYSQCFCSQGENTHLVCGHTKQCEVKFLSSFERLTTLLTVLYAICSFRTQAILILQF